MSNPCQDSGRVSGVYFETRSVNGNKTVCTLAGAGTIHHVVEIHNLNAYPASISCKSSITASPRKVEFSSTTPGVSPTDWSGSQPKLAPHGVHTFNHVELTACGKGAENITVDIQHHCLMTGRQRPIVLNIRVTA
jgi:hypothetical protein